MPRKELLCTQEGCQPITQGNVQMKKGGKSLLYGHSPIRLSGKYIKEYIRNGLVIYYHIKITEISVSLLSD